MTIAETLAAQVQAAREAVLDAATWPRCTCKPPQEGHSGDCLNNRLAVNQANLDRYAYLVGLQTARESVVRIGCMRECRRLDRRRVGEHECLTCREPSNYPCAASPCSRCDELRRIDAEIALGAETP